MLKTKNNEDLKRWLFCFQKCVALVLSHLIDSANAYTREQYANHAALLSRANQEASVEGAQATFSRESLGATTNEVRNIESGVGMSQDYSSFIGSAVDPEGANFDRRESKNHTLTHMRSVNTRSSSASGSGGGLDSSSFLEGLGLEEGHSAGMMPYGRSRKASAGRSSLPPGIGTASFHERNKNEDVASTSDLSGVDGGDHGSGSRGNDSDNASIDVSASDTTHAEMLNAQRYFIPLKGELRPGVSSTNLCAYNREEGAGHRPRTMEVGNNVQSVASSLGTGQMMAASPAIPIFPSMGPSNPARTISAEGASASSLPPALKVAGSYEDNDGKTSVLAKAIDLLDVADGSEDEEFPEAFSDDDGGQLEEDDGDMMFGMDDSQDRASASGGAGFGTGQSPQPGSRSSHSEKNSSRDGGSSCRASGTMSPVSPRSRTNSSDALRKSPKFSPATVLSNMAALEGSHERSITGRRWIGGACSRIGPRNSNEDRYVLVNSLNKPHHNGSTNSSPVGGLSGQGDRGISSSGSIVGSSPNPEEYGFFAVYDGHCGNQAAQYLQDHLHQRVFAHSNYPGDLETALAKTCVSIDNEFLDICEERKWYSGSTALGIVLREDKLYMFNIGDCMAVLCRTNGLASVMNTPHKPGQPDEERRIKKANGWITEEKELYMGRLHRMDLSDPVVRDKAQKVTWVVIHRVCGELAVSRSIGDPDYKRFTPHAKVDALFNWPDDHNEAFAADLVVPDPEVKVFNLSKSDEFFIIASDGLWDVVGAEDAIVKTRSSLHAGKSPYEAAEELCDLALKLGSSDNVTVIVVKLLDACSQRSP